MSVPPKLFRSQWPSLCALLRSSVFSWHRAGLGHQCRNEPGSSGSPAISRTSLLVPFVPLTLSQFSLSLISRLLFTRVVSLCRFLPPLPRQSIYLWLASSSRADPGVEWRAVGGRAGLRAGHLTVRSLPCWHDPQCAHARTHTHTRCRSN